MIKILFTAILGLVINFSAYADILTADYQEQDNQVYSAATNFETLDLSIDSFNGLCTLPSSSTFRFRNGELALNVKRDSVRVKIVARENSGRYVVKYLEGPLRGQVGGNWPSSDLAKRRGCGNGFCVGKRAYNIKRDSSLVKVIGVQENRLLVVKYLDGSLKGKKGHGWSREDLAKTSGCGEGFCVGDLARNTQRNYVLVKVVGIQSNGLYVVKYLEGNLKGLKGGNWAESDLARVH